MNISHCIIHSLYLVLWVISSLDLLQIKLLQNYYVVLYVDIYFHFL